MRYDAFLFDFDGVLADTEPLHHRAWNQTLEPHGIQWDWDYYVNHCVGVADEKLARVTGAAEAVCREMVAGKQKRFRAMLLASPPFFDATRDLIRQLAEIRPMAVVSSSAKIEVQPALASAGIDTCFERIICCDDVRNLKPHPEPYRTAAHALAAKLPLVIEDSNFGVASARAAGFEVLRISSPATMAGELKEFLRIKL